MNARRSVRFVRVGNFKSASTIELSTRYPLPDNNYKASKFYLRLRKTALISVEGDSPIHASLQKLPHMVPVHGLFMVIYHHVVHNASIRRQSREGLIDASVIVLRNGGNTVWSSQELKPTIGCNKGGKKMTVHIQ